MSDLIFANSAISAHMATYGLNQPRIHALIRAKTQEQINILLQELGNENAYQKFMEYCDDPALKICVKAIHEFKTRKSDSVAKSEKQLLSVIEKSIDKIKYDKAREYFVTYSEAFKVNKKIPESRLFKIARDMRYDNTTIGPIFYWYVLKQAESTAVKTILMGKQAGFENDEILQNLKGLGLYERFE